MFCITQGMRTEAPPAGSVARPPANNAATAGSASVRPTAQVRPIVPVELIRSSAGFRPDDPYVRRFWVAALGPGAIAELLRLVRAAEKGEGVRLPRYLPQLLKANLVTSSSGALAVSNRIPAVPRELQWRFPPSLAGEHTRWLGPSASGGQ